MPAPGGPPGEDPARADFAAAAGRATIVAKGRGALAEQIVQRAFAAGVKVRRDADLAEILDAVDLDAEVPVEAITAVAEILNYLYRANRRIADGPDDDGALPGPASPAHAP